MPDDHSEVVPLLPIPNRTVKRLCADDSADSRVKVGHRQAINLKTPSCRLCSWAFCIYELVLPFEQLLTASTSRRNERPADFELGST
jgi:hypothetical protein